MAGVLNYSLSTNGIKEFYIMLSLEGKKINDYISQQVTEHCLTIYRIAFNVPSMSLVLSHSLSVIFVLFAKKHSLVYKCADVIREFNQTTV